MIYISLEADNYYNLYLGWSMAKWTGISFFVSNKQNVVIERRKSLIQIFWVVSGKVELGKLRPYFACKNLFAESHKKNSCSIFQSVRTTLPSTLSNFKRVCIIYQQSHVHIILYYIQFTRIRSVSLYNCCFMCMCLIPSRLIFLHRFGPHW